MSIVRVLHLRGSRCWSQDVNGHAETGGQAFVQQKPDRLQIEAIEQVAQMRVKGSRD